MVDYRKFLGKREERVLPYLGGDTVEAPGRVLRLKGTRPAPGWHRFDLRGRDASPIGPAEPEGLPELPRERGHLWGPRLVGSTGLVERVHLLPEDEPPLFAPATARRWHSGQLLFEQLEFEEEVEETARRRLEDGISLDGAKGVPASLRAAFAYARLEAVGRGLGIAVHPLEVRAHAAELAAGGPAAVERFLRGLAAQREQFARRFPPQELRPGRWAGDRALEAAGEALRVAGAVLLRARRLADRQLEVTYRFMNNRFLTVVQADTLRVVDPGVCIHDEDQLTLDSLPGVIREAIESGALVITRAVNDDD